MLALSVIAPRYIIIVAIVALLGVVPLSLSAQQTRATPATRQDSTASVTVRVQSESAGDRVVSSAIVRIGTVEAGQTTADRRRYGCQQADASSWPRESDIARILPR
jgi:hypothetical protein